jgi:hypothetical protein
VHNLARFLIVLGVVFVLAGSCLLLFPKLALFRLPGDVVLKKDNTVFILPVATSLLLSIILTIILNIQLRK